MNEINSSIAERYYAYLRLEKGLSTNTFMAYKRDLAKLLAFSYEENIDLLHISTDDIHRFIIELGQQQIKSISQARIISGIRSFYHFLVLEEIISTDPTELIEAPRTERKLPSVLTVYEIDQIIASINLSTNEGQRNKAILETLYSCGLRVSELVNLKISNLYLDEEYISVIGKGNKQRFVPISQSAIHEIKNYFLFRQMQTVQRGEEDILFLNRSGKRLTRAMIFHIIKKHAELAGIKKIISPHTFRHSFATHMLEGGANLRIIQEILGHEDIATTEIYTHLDTDFLRSEVLRFHPRNKRKKTD